MHKYNTNKFFKDKRIVIIYVVVILLIIIGIAFALSESSYAFNTDTGVYGIDETAYGETHFDSANLDLKPILDSDITTKTDNVIKIDFTVGGSENNPTDRNIIYDIALNDLDIDCDLLSPYMKWKLVKNGEELSSGNLSNSFDTIVDNRLVLTNTQVDLPTYSSTQSGYHNYTFYLWVSDSCQSSNLSECINDEDQSNLSGKSLSGKIEVELNTGVKKTNTKHPSEGDACSNIQKALFDPKGGYVNISSKEIVNGEAYGTLPTPTKDNYVFDGWYLDEEYTLEVNENSIVSTIDNVVLYAKWSIPTAANDIINLYNDGSTINTVNIAGDSSKPQVNLNATQGIMLDNNGNYRYYGANPNNYVTFNGETWRIIGAFNNVDDGTGKKEIRLKIIRNDSIGSYSYDSSASTVNSGNGVNDWSKADLNTELNTLYYNSTSGTCYNGSKNASTTCDFSSTGLKSEARNMIDNAVYHLGGSSSYEGLYANDYYTFERGTTVYSCSTDDGACPRATTWTGKVGLMYPSDYAYATDLSLCTTSGYNYNTSSNCYGKDWLYNSAYQWNIAPYSSDAYNVFYVGSTGYVGKIYARSTRGVRPAVYLKSNVAIVSGEGTSSNPYQLELS